jgi:hypothetical protein
MWLIIPFLVLFYVFFCSPAKHQTSLHAAFMNVVTHVAPGDIHSEVAVVPLCPIQGCSAVLTQEDIVSIIGRGFDERLHASPDFAGLIQGKTRNQLEATAKAVVFKRAMITTGMMRCPFCVSADGTEYWFEGHGSPRKGRIICPNESCGMEFCGDCNLSPYHYHCTCNQVIRYVRLWNEWCESGRDAYVDAMHAQDEDYASRRAEFDRAQEGQDPICFAWFL